MLVWLGIVVVLGVGAGGLLGSGFLARGSNSSARDQAAWSDSDPIEILKQRYVGGEIDLEEFEIRAKRLYETDGEETGDDHERVRRPYFSGGSEPTTGPRSGSGRSAPELKVGAMGRVGGKNRLAGLGVPSGHRYGSEGTFLALRSLRLV